MKWILSILVLLVSSSVFGQGFTYSYVDPCSKKLKVIQIPNANSTVTVNYLGYVNTFTKDDFDNGNFAGWVGGLSAKFASAPCDEIKTKTQVSQNTIITQNIISTLSSVTAVSTMTVASSVGSMTSGGLSNSVDNSSSGESSGNSSGNSSGKSEDNKNESGKNTDNPSSNNPPSNPPSQGNTPSGTNSPQTGGGNTSSGTNSPQTGSNNTQSGSNTAQPNQTSGSNTNKNEPNTSSGGATNSSGNSGSSGGNSGSSGGSSSNSGGSGGNSNGSGSSGGNSGGSSGSGGNIDSKPKTQDPTTTPADSKSGGNGGTTNSVSNAAESSSGGSSSEGGSNGGGGKGGSKTTTAKTGSVIGTGDVVVIRSNEDKSNQFKATMSVTKSNTDNSKTKGALLNFTTTINNSNLTFYAAFSNKTRTNTLITANSSMVDFERNFFNTTTVLESHRWGKFSGMLGANYTIGTLDNAMFSNLSAVGGGFYLFKPSPKITGTILMLGVYSPFTKFMKEDGGNQVSWLCHLVHGIMVYQKHLSST